MKKPRVAVLMGGTSSERAVSLSTGRQIVAALQSSRYEVTALDPAALRGVLPSPEETALVPAPGLQPLCLEQWSGKSATQRPDVAFIALHGRGGEDGTIQGLLEILGIPYVGSGVLASALAMDKSMTKRVLQSHGLPVPAEALITRAAACDLKKVHHAAERLGYPLVVKPNQGGSTIGCTIVREPGQLEEALRAALREDEAALLEQFIAGVEITAGVLGNEIPQVLPLIEIVAKGGFYDYEAKYSPGGSEHIIPARISESAAAAASDYAGRAHIALGCRGMCRVDMLVTNDQPVILEVNTIPGMTPTSLLPEAARAAGISFPDLLERLLRLALERVSE